MNIRMKGISKSFGANLVLDKVDFNVHGGEITALLGENGAGKSTLMNILGGVIEKNEGEIEIDGNIVAFNTPKDSLDSGIAFIHQELNLINDLPIYENLFIGRELKKKHGALDHKKMIEETEKIFRRMDLDLDPRTMVSSLDASYKQIIEISRAIMSEAKIVIMDEPTTSLTEPEIQRVFVFMRKLREEGVGLIFISHKLNEVKEICDRYTVLRDGHMVSEGNVADVAITDIATMMVGHEIHTGTRDRSFATDETILKVTNLSDDKHFRNISFELKKGEVLGFTGLLGDGRSELFQTIFGAMGSSYTGEIEMAGEKCHITTTMQAVAKGIGYVPRNRKENAIIKDLSILENGSLVTLSSRNRKGRLSLDRERIESEFETEKKKLRIKMGSNDDLITSLSGGNQQKVVLAKWLNMDPKVLILDNPTQGVDVGAKEDIYDIIVGLAERGIAVIVLSSESQEIIRLCDRTYVLYHGNIMGELGKSEMNENEIMKMATGVKD